MVHCKVLFKGHVVDSVVYCLPKLLSDTSMQVTATATLSCSSVNYIYRNKLGRITGASTVWDPVAPT